MCLTTLQKVVEIVIRSFVIDWILVAVENNLMILSLSLEKEYLTCQPSSPGACLYSAHQMA
jgi:hypothetical protein